MNRWVIMQAIATIHNAIRHHRDQSGEHNNDRCWADDHLLYSQTLPWRKHQRMLLPRWEDMHERCQNHCLRRQGYALSEDRERIAQRPPLELQALSNAQLLGEQLRLIALITFHDILGGLKTYEHDIMLYEALPEGLLPDIEFAPFQERILKCESFCREHAGKNIRTMEEWASVRE